MCCGCHAITSFVKKKKWKSCDNFMGQSLAIIKVADSSLLNPNICLRLIIIISLY